MVLSVARSLASGLALILGATHGGTTTKAESQDNLSSIRSYCHYNSLTARDLSKTVRSRSSLTESAIPFTNDSARLI